MFKEDLQKSKLTESLKVDLHIAREMEIEQSPSLVFFSEDVHEEGLKVEGFIHITYTHTSSMNLWGHQLKRICLRS